MKAWFLKLHRWIALVFSIPLAVLIVTGLMLSFNPILFDRASTVPLANVEAALARFDADRKATTLNMRAYEGVMALSAGRGGPSKRISLATNTEVPGTTSLWSETMTTAQRLHETFLLDLGWLVAASTYAMLVFMALGTFMGWGNFRNSLGGWHRMTAWFLLPLLILSPLTGLALYHRITFTPPPPRPADPPATLHEAVKLIAAKHDLAKVMWIRPLGPNLGARLYDNGRATTYAVTKTGLVQNPTPWPRLLHEGTWAGTWSGIVNVVTSLAFVLLLVTGLTIWSRRTLRRATRART